MKNRVLLCTHGRFGEELLRSAEMILGKIEGVACCSLTSEMSLEDYRDTAESELKKVSENVICLVDLFGGTPSNVMGILTKKYPIQVVTGVNLPMLIEVYLNVEAKTTEELAELALDTLRESGNHINAILKEG